MATPAIKVEGLGKKYRLVHGQERTRYRTLRESLVDAVKAPFRKRGTTEEFWALNDVSFEVQPGEVVGIIGRNGAGKSTLLKILSRITKPTTGRVEINGRVGSLLEVGTGFHPELTGRENIYLNGAILGMSRAEIARKFDEIVAFAEVEKFLDTPVKRYSSGMYVRLAFAVAAHLEPEILIVDEVLAVGDQAFQKKCLGKMKDVSRGGRTVLFVSHNMATMRSLCTTGVVLERGRVSVSGFIEDCVRAYHQDATNNLGSATISTPPRTTARVKGVRLVAADGTLGVMHYGDDLRVEVEFEADPPTECPQLGLVITSSEGMAVLSTNSHFQPPPRSGKRLAHGTITCELVRPPLMAGEYTVSLWFGTHHIDTHVLEDAVRFEVRERDVWGGGKLPPRGAAPCWCPASFHIHPTA